MIMIVMALNTLDFGDGLLVIIANTNFSEIVRLRVRQKHSGLTCEPTLAKAYLIVLTFLH